MILGRPGRRRIALPHGQLQARSKRPHDEESRDRRHLLLCSVLMAAPGVVAEFVARADDSAAALYSGVNGFRQPCGPLTDDPHLRVAAQRHADDMLHTGISGHIGSDGSSPRTRIADAGYTRTPPRVRLSTGAPGQRRIPPRPSTRGCKAPAPGDYRELRFHGGRLRHRLGRQQNDRGG